MKERLVLPQSKLQQLREALFRWANGELPELVGGTTDPYYLDALRGFVWAESGELPSAVRNFFAVGIAPYALANFYTGEEAPNEVLLRDALEGQYLRRQAPDEPLLPEATVMASALETIFDPPFILRLRDVLPQSQQKEVTEARPELLPTGGGANTDPPRRRRGITAGLIAAGLILLLIGGGLTYILWPAQSPVSHRDDRKPFVPPIEDKDKRQQGGATEKDKDKSPADNKGKTTADKGVRKDDDTGKQTVKTPNEVPKPKEKTAKELFDEWWKSAEVKVAELKPGRALSRFSEKEAQAVVGDLFKGAESEVAGCVAYHHLLKLKVTKDSVGAWVGVRHYTAKHGLTVWKKDPDFGSTPTQIWSALGRNQSKPEEALTPDDPKDKAFRAARDEALEHLKGIPELARAAPRVRD